jgi:hypothetical protein
MQLSLPRLRYRVTWRQPWWPLALVLLLGGLLWLIWRLPPHFLPGSILRLQPTPPPATTAKPVIDPVFLPVMEAARREAVELGQRRLVRLVGTLDQRVEADFLPRYLTFGRRKLEEIKAYNTYAWSQIKSLFGSPRGDAAMPVLIANFERYFSQQVLTPAATRQALRAIGREIARYYGVLVAAGLEKVQEARGLGFAQWQQHLAGFKPGQIWLPSQGTQLTVPVRDLAVPDPVRNQLGDAIGDALVERFDHYPKVTSDIETLRTPDGKGIFDIGKNAWAYYGSYVVYWIVLIILLRSGIIPVNLFAFLLGWLAWETFVWGTWIGLEALDFEQTRAQVEPVILRHTDAYFDGMRKALTDPTSSGPFQVLQELGHAWRSH